MGLMDLTGVRFERLTVLRRVPSTQQTKPRWLCQCDCGAVIETQGSQLRRGQTKSCGCLMIERTKSANTKHGGKGTRMYRIWSGMKNRCLNPNSKDYSRYGGRGIKVCDRWRLSYECFATDMGPMPDVHSTIERRQTNGNYEPANCVWATAKDQANNRRTSVLVTHNGQTKTASQWDEVFGFFRGTVARRARQGVKIDSPINHNLARKKHKRATDIPVHRQEVYEAIQREKESESGSDQTQGQSESQPQAKPGEAQRAGWGPGGNCKP